MTTFLVLGRPVPQGSMRPIVSQSTGRAFVKQSPPLAVWRADVAEAARRAGVSLEAGPVALGAVFSFPRPKGHMGTGRNAGRLRASAPARPINRAQGDVDKLLRAVLDALSGVAYLDDSQVVEIASARKRYCDHGEPASAVVTVSRV